MAKYATLKAAVEAAIRTNGAQQITGQVLQTQLVNMITSLGKYFQSFGGLATPAGSFSAGDESVTFLAVEAGTYTNFGGAVLDGKTLHILAYDGDWADVDTLIPSGAALTAALANYTTTEDLEATYAKKDGSYDALTAGRAKNIDGKNSLEGTFLFRTTAGDADVASGVATVEKVKGNAVAFNQLVALDSLIINRLSISGTVDHITATVTEIANNSTANRMGISAIFGRFYYVSCEVVSQRNFTMRSSGLSTALAQEVTAGVKTKCAIISPSAGSSGRAEIGFNSEADGFEVNDTIEIYNFKIIDLTLIFGAGNEPSSVALFESWLAANVGNKPYFPATQKLLPTKLLGLKTRGFNQWDEETKLGIYDSDGEFQPNNTHLACKNPIRVFPNTAYHFRTNGYNINVVYLAADGVTAISDFNTEADVTKTTPVGCYYIVFNMAQAYGTTYNHDICINLSWDGSRDGEYEPYDEREYNLDVTKFYGKLNGAGDLVQIFPNGMRKADYAGTVRDLLDLVNAEADVKVGSEDLGTPNWQRVDSDNYASLVPFFVTNIPQNAGGKCGLICSKYPYTGGDRSALTDKSLSAYSSNTANHQVAIADSALSSLDADAFKAAMDGVELYYELATPLHYTDLVYRDNGVDTPVEALNILVNNWGTEEEIVAAPEASGEPNSCAATLDILYGIDAAEQLDTINQSGIFTDSLKANLEALIGVLNTNCSEALGGTIAISDTPTDKVYTFTFTPNAE